MSDAIRKICCRLTSAWKMRLRCLHLFVALLVFAPFPLASSVLLGVYVINVLVIGWHILAWFITPASSEKVFPSGICAAFGLQLRRWTETALASWWLSGCCTWSVPGAASSSALTIPLWSKLLADWPAHGIGGIPRSTRRMKNVPHPIIVPNSRACWVSISIGLGLARGDLQPSKSGMEPWNPGTLEPWNPGTLEPWNPGTLKPWNPGTLKPRNPGTLEPWNLGTPRTLEPWNLGTLEPWNPGTILEPCDRGTLKPWNLATLHTWNPARILEPWNPGTLGTLENLGTLQPWDTWHPAWESWNPGTLGTLGTLKPWNRETVGPWYAANPGTLKPWTQEPSRILEPCYLGTLEPWNPAHLAPCWDPGTLKPWNPWNPWNPGNLGTLKKWDPGTLEPGNPWNPKTSKP